MTMIKLRKHQNNRHSNTVLAVVCALTLRTNTHASNQSVKRQKIRYANLSDAHINIVTMHIHYYKWDPPAFKSTKYAENMSL